jgi:cAMP-dependent protein kinase regulator
MAEDKALRKARTKLDKALEANRNEEAIKLLAELRRYEPQNARWPHKQGDLLRRLNRNVEAVEAYGTAAQLYADGGFIARAVAMAKTVVTLDPARIEVLERIDPVAAQQLRSNKRVMRHPMLLDDALPGPSMPPARPSLPQTAPAAVRGAPPPVPHGLAARTPYSLQAPPPPPAAARRGPPPPPHDAARPVKVRGITLDRLSLPPLRSQRMAAAAAPEPAPSLEIADIYSKALDYVAELALDPRAPANETRFSDAPSRSANEVELSEVELAEREPLPLLESLRPEPPPAETLAKLPLFPLFAEVPQPVLSKMVAGSELVELAHEAYVVRHGDPGDALYGIVEGSVNVIVPGQPYQLTLAEGDVFGEACLLEDEKLHADAIVAGKLTALRVPRQLLLEILQEHPPLAELLLELLTRRLLGNLLQTSPLFQEFDNAGRMELARMFEIRRAPAGTMLAVVGKRMDGLYISLTGTLSVNQPGAPVRIAPPGSMFGQNALLSNALSQIDVSTQVNMIVLRLPAAQFTRVAMQYPMLLARLAELSTSEMVRVTIGA